MCGRYAFNADPQTVTSLFGLVTMPEPLQPRFNVAPSQKVPVVAATADGLKRKLGFLTWGLVPAWSNDGKGYRPVNARAETVHSAGTFAESFRRKRCLLPATGFYEWQVLDKKRKQPHFIRMRDGQPFAFAGLWSDWTDGVTKLLTCCSLTTTPNEMMRPIHDRMPVIIAPEHFMEWLAVDTPEKRLKELLRPFPSHEMEAFRLADHAQSRDEQEKDWIASTATDKPPPLPMRTQGTEYHPLQLSGLDGANPLAFMAALGTLRLAERAFPGCRLSWQSNGVWMPVLHLPEQLTPDSLIEAILPFASTGRRSMTFAPDLKIRFNEYRSFESESVQAAHNDREFADFLRSFADPLVTIQAGPNAGKTKPTEFYMIAGQQKLLKQALEIASACNVKHLAKCLFAPWVYDDPLDGLSLRWDPQDDLRYATRFVNPSKDRTKSKRGSVLGANRLAFESLPFFPCFAAGSRLATTGFSVLDRSPHFTWPIWSAAWGINTIRSVLSTVESPRRTATLQRVKIPEQLGVLAWYQCEKVPNSDYSNFAPAQAL